LGGGFGAAFLPGFEEVAAGFGEDETREMIVAGSRRVAGE